MKSKINVNREYWKNDINKYRGLEASVLIDAASPINAGSLLKRRGFEVRVLINACGVY